MSVIQENIYNDHENDISIFDEKEIPFEKYIELTEHINKLIQKIKDIHLDKQKDYDKYEKNVNYFLNKYKDIKITELSFFNRTIGDIKKNIKLEKKKKKINKDKSKYFVNLQKNAPLFVLEMMNKKEGETVSQSQVLNSIIQLIKKCLSDDFNNFVVYKENGKIDNTKFQIKDKLLLFFNEVKDEANKRGDIIVIPEYLGYPNLMTYLKYVIYK
jgi:hypothetical protein